jgi:RNA processing factor Prp31
MDRLLRGEIPPGGSCDIKTLALAAGVDRTAVYGDRPYTHLRAEFERRARQLQHSGQTPDQKRRRSNDCKPTPTNSETA